MMTACIKKGVLTASGLFLVCFSNISAANIASCPENLISNEAKPLIVSKDNKGQLSTREFALCKTKDSLVTEILVKRADTPELTLTFDERSKMTQLIAVRNEHRQEIPAVKMQFVLLGTAAVPGDEEREQQRIGINFSYQENDDRRGVVRSGTLEDLTIRFPDSTQNATIKGQAFEIKNTCRVEVPESVDLGSIGLDKLTFKSSNVPPQKTFTFKVDCDLEGTARLTMTWPPDGLADGMLRNIAGSEKTATKAATGVGVALYEKDENAQWKRMDLAVDPYTRNLGIISSNNVPSSFEYGASMHRHSDQGEAVSPGALKAQLEWTVSYD